MSKQNALILMALLALNAADAVASSTTLISNNASKITGNDDSNNASVSTGGAALAFQSDAMNFVAQDGNRSTDIYLKVGKKVDLVSVNSDGAVARVGTSWKSDGANADSSSPSIDAGGKFVVFQSTANNLDIPGSAADTSIAGGVGGEDIFLRDVRKKKTYRLSGILAGAGNPDLKDDDAWKVATSADEDSFNPAISNDGKVVVFESEATNLVTIAGVTFAASTKRIYAIDLETKKIELVSAVHDSSGNPTALPKTAASVDVAATNPAVSPDGRFVVYTSSAVNLDTAVTSTGTNKDVFVYDRTTFKTYQLSGVIAEAGGGTATLTSGFKVTTEGDRDSDNAAISGSKKLYFVAFQSKATNLDAMTEGAASSNNDDDVFVVGFGPNASDETLFEIKNPNATRYKSVDSPSSQQTHPVKRISAILDEFGDYETDTSVVATPESSWDDSIITETANSTVPVIAAKGNDYVVAFKTAASNLLSTNDNPDVRAPSALKSHEAYWQEDSNNTNGTTYDIYVYDSKKKLYRRANVDPEGIQGSASAAAPAISPEGKAVAFETTDDHLTWDIIPGGTQIFLRKE